jgi:hypothetical protein
MSAHIERRAEAMFRRGVSPEEIAKQVGIDMQQFQSWVQEWEASADNSPGALVMAAFSRNAVPFVGATMEAAQKLLKQIHEKPSREIALVTKSIRELVQSACDVVTLCNPEAKGSGRKTESSVLNAVNVQLPSSAPVMVHEVEDDEEDGEQGERPQRQTPDSTANAKFRRMAEQRLRLMQEPADDVEDDRDYRVPPTPMDAVRAGEGYGDGT